MSLKGLITVLGVGAIAGMLLAPKKGSELREEIKENANKAYDKAKDLTKEDLETMVNDTISKVKKTVDEFDFEEFKDDATKQFNNLSEKLEELVTNVKESEQFSKAKDSIEKISKDINDKVDQVMIKIKDKDMEGLQEIDDSIDEIEEEIDVIIEDLKN